MIMPIVFLTVIGIAIYVLPILLTNLRVDENQAPLYGAANITALCVYLTIMAIFIPLYEFSPLKSRRGADLYYSLPLDRKRLYTQFYLKGLIELSVSYLIVFILGLLSSLVKGYHFEYIYYLPLFFLLLITMIGYYSFNVFLCIKNNRTIDTAIIIVLYMIVPYIFMFALSVLFNKTSIALSSGYAPVAMINHIGVTFSRRIEALEIVTNQLANHVYTGIWFIIGIFSFLSTLFVKTYNNPEDVQQKSNTWFGYKILIPMTLFSMIIGPAILISTTNIISIVLSLVIAYVGYVIYERKFKISAASLITLISVGFLSTLLALLQSMLS